MSFYEIEASGKTQLVYGKSRTEVKEKFKCKEAVPYDMPIITRLSIEREKYEQQKELLLKVQQQIAKTQKRLQEFGSAKRADLIYYRVTFLSSGQEIVICAEGLEMACTYIRQRYNNIDFHIDQVLETV
jgi:hypothetical protein